MPTYVFACKECGHEFNLETSWSSKSEARCPKCESKSLKELFGRYTLNVISNDSGAPVQACGPGCACASHN